MDLKQTYNLIAAGWHAKHSSDDWWVEAAEKFVSGLKPGASVLDAGCGTGVKSRYLVDRGLNITGVDFAEKMAEIASANVPEAKFQVWDLREIEKYPDTFEGIFAQAVFLHFPKKEFSSILNKLLTRLKSSGKILISVKQKRPDGPEEGLITDSQYGETYTRFFSFFEIDEVNREFEKAGLKITFSKIVANPKWKNNWITVIGEKI